MFFVCLWAFCRYEPCEDFQSEIQYLHVVTQTSNEACSAANDQRVTNITFYGQFSLLVPLYKFSFLTPSFMALKITALTLRIKIWQVMTHLLCQSVSLHSPQPDECHYVPHTRSGRQICFPSIECKICL